MAFESEQRDHHAEIITVGHRVKLGLWTWVAGGVTEKDVDLARAIDAVSSGQERGGGGTQVVDRSGRKLPELRGLCRTRLQRQDQRGRGAAQRVAYHARSHHLWGPHDALPSCGCWLEAMRTERRFASSGDGRCTTSPPSAADTASAASSR